VPLDFGTGSDSVCLSGAEWCHAE